MKAPFDYATAKKMFDHIGRCLAGDTCDGSLRFTKAWLNEYFNGDKEKIVGAVIFLENHGGFCDCEVLMNVAHRTDIWL